MSKDWPNNLIDTAEVYEYNNETLTINNSHKTDGLENNLDNSHYSFQRTLNYTVDGSMTIWDGNIKKIAFLLSGNLVK